MSGGGFNAGLLLAPFGIGATVAFAYLAARSLSGTIAIVIGVWLVTQAVRDSVALAVSVSGLQIFLLDVISLILLAIALARIATQGFEGLPGGLLLALLALTAVHIIRGMGEFGVPAAVNAGRPWLYFAAAALYVFTFPGGWSRQAWKVFIGGGAILAGLAFLFTARDGVGTATEIYLRGDAWVTGRPVAAAGTLVILQAAIIALAISWPSPTRAKALAVTLGSAVVLLQHRTVWAAGLLCGLAGYVWWSSLQRGALQYRAFIGTGVLLLALPMAAVAFSQTGTLVESAAEVTSSNSTFVWRTSGWEQLISERIGPLSLVTGDPAGASMGRTVMGETIEYSAHNGLVDAYVRFGVPGVFVILWLAAVIWRRRRSVADALGIESAVVMLLLLTQAAFIFAYSWDSLQGLLIGALAGAAAVRREEPWHTAQARREVVRL